MRVCLGEKNALCAAQVSHSTNAAFATGLVVSKTSFQCAAIAAVESVSGNVVSIAGELALRRRRSTFVEACSLISVATFINLEIYRV